MKRLKILLIALSVAIVPMAYILVNQESDYPALNWITLVLVSAITCGVFVTLLSLGLGNSDEDEITYHDDGWD